MTMDHRCIFLFSSVLCHFIFDWRLHFDELSMSPDYITSADSWTLLKVSMITTASSFMHQCKRMSNANQWLVHFPTFITYLYSASFCVWKVQRVNHLCWFVLNDCQNVVKVTAFYMAEKAWVKTVSISIS